MKHGSELTFFFKRVIGQGSQGENQSPYHARTNVFLNILQTFGLNVGGAGNEEKLDRLVRDLHGEANPSYTTYDLFTSFRAFYPIIGGGFFQHSLNLVDYSAFALTYNGSPTHNANGILTDGTTQDAITHYNPFLQASLGNYSVGIYNRVKLSGSGNPWIFGAYDGNMIGIRVQSSGFATGIGVNRFIDGISEAVGKHICVEVEGTTTGRLYSNGSLVNSWSAGATKPNNNVRISSVGGAAYADTDTQTFWISERIFTSAEHLAISNAITAYNTALGRG